LTSRLFIQKYEDYQDANKFKSSASTLVKGYIFTKSLRGPRIDYLE